MANRKKDREEGGDVGEMVNGLFVNQRDIMGLRIVFICAVFLVSVTTAAQFNVSAAMYFSVPSLRALASVVLTTIPGFIYVGKNISIDFHLNWAPLLEIHVENVMGTKVDLSEEVTIFNVSHSVSTKTLSAGVLGWTTSLALRYNLSILWGLVDMQGPMNITVKSAGATLDATFQESKLCYLFTVQLGNTYVTYDSLDIQTGIGYWLADYVIQCFEFALPTVLNGAFRVAISEASAVLNNFLQHSRPEGTLLPILPHTGLIMKPLTSLDLNPQRETLVLKQLAVQVVDIKTREPYFDREITTQPVFLESLGLQNQVLISDNVLNSMVKALALDIPDLLQYNTSDDSVGRLLDDVPEIGQVYGEHLDYVLKYQLTPDVHIIANRSLIELSGNMSSILYVKLDPNNPTKMITFHSQVKFLMNVTVANYRLFVMIKNVAVESADYIIHDDNLILHETPEEVVTAMQNMFLEESSCLNGRYLLPYDLKKNQMIGYAAKYLKDGSVRFDKIDHFFVLGFNAYAL